jgi:mRNA interferase RelE/StbE
MTYRIEFLPRADKEFRALQRGAQNRIGRRIDALASDPRPHQAKPLRGGLKGRWALRVGDYRVIYSIHDDVLVVLVVSVGSRGGIYGDTGRRG